MWVAFNYFKKNEKTVIFNLENQDYEYFIPKVLIKIDSNIKTDNLFPGYGFVKYNHSITSLNFTRGVNKVVRFGSNYGLLNDDQIKKMKILMDESFASPIILRKPINSEVILVNGPLKGIFGKLISYSSSERVEVLYNMLGKNLTIETEERNLALL